MRYTTASITLSKHLPQQRGAQGEEQPYPALLTGRKFLRQHHQQLGCFSSSHRTHGMTLRPARR